MNSTKAIPTPDSGLMRLSEPVRAKVLQAMARGKAVADRELARGQITSKDDVLRAALSAVTGTLDHTEPEIAKALWALLEVTA